jgi:hypothetical protein
MLSKCFSKSEKSGTGKDAATLRYANVLEVAFNAKLMNQLLMNESAG